MKTCTRDFNPSESRATGAGFLGNVEVRVGEGWLSEKCRSKSWQKVVGYRNVDVISKDQTQIAYCTTDVRQASLCKTQIDNEEIHACGRRNRGEYAWKGMMSIWKLF